MGAYFGIFDGDYIRHIRYCNETDIGKTLSTHYNSIEMAMALIRFGNVLTLGNSIDETEFYIDDERQLYYDYCHVSKYINTIAKDLSTSMGYAYSTTKGRWYVISRKHTVFTKAL